VEGFVIAPNKPESLCEKFVGVSGKRCPGGPKVWVAGFCFQGIDEGVRSHDTG
jgi:hypothetical protein